MGGRLSGCCVLDSADGAPGRWLASGATDSALTSDSSHPLLLSTMVDYRPQLPVAFVEEIAK